MNKKVREITELSLFIAIVIVMALIPYLGYISIGAFSVTIIHIPVLIAGMKYKVKGGLIVGLAFGITSMMIAMIRPMAVTDTLFINPLVSVLPRALFGIIVGLGPTILNKFSYQKVTQFLWMVASTILHTILVIGMLYIVQYKELINLNMIDSTVSIVVFVGGFLLVSLIEGIAGAVIATPILSILQKKGN